MAGKVICGLVLWCALCYPAEVVWITAQSEATASGRSPIEVASRYYGAALKKVAVGSKSDTSVLSTAVHAKTTLAVVLSSSALPLVDRRALVGAMKQRASGPVPVWIAAAPGTDPDILRAWSGVPSIACSRVATPGGARYRVGNLKGITQDLSGLDVRFADAETAAFVLPQGSTARAISAVTDSGRTFPVFIQAEVDGVNVFLACDRQAPADSFTAIAAELMFLKYSAGEQGWHSLYRYANLTIDDPWLRNPYGYVQYRNLLAEMEKADFHTTIAFVPWNYDRSEPAVADLFRSNPRRLSIAIHGNNHDHKEFTDYHTKPLNQQIEDVSDSLARMSRFYQLTRIPYDKVMVFPHSIAPAATLGILKSYNFMATVNSGNVPMDAAAPADFAAAARSVTVAFANFASIRRYSIEGPLPEGLIQIESFLGNPLLFYGHHEFFSSGIDAFDPLAKEVNTRVPDTRWRSLGEIARHEYLVRLRDDANYDVLAFSSEIALDNPNRWDAVFHFRRQENGEPAIAQVLVDGKRHPYELRGGYLEMSVAVPGHASRNVAITYRTELIAERHPTTHAIHVWFLRMSSDFRDNFLSKSTVGLWVVRRYYDSGMSAAGAAALSMAGIILMLLAMRPLLAGRTALKK